jgi:alanine dehydrogenase
MVVGTVKEIKKHEYRVGMTPDNVKDYILNGHTVLVQKGAGMGSSFSDEEYQKSGAKLVETAKEVWDTADMIVKVKEPIEAEHTLMRKGQILYTYLHLAADKPLTEAMLKCGVKGVAYETITDKNGTLPLLTPMSEVAGKLSVQEGAKYLEKPFGGRGVLLGGVAGTKKGKVVILGGGVVGINACKIAVGMGADVTIMDVNLDRLRYLEEVFGDRITTMYSTDAAIEKELTTADLVIGGVLIPGAAAPKLIKRSYLKNMLPGSVIVDVAVDQGGCSETTKATYHDEPTFVVDGVVNYCVANMPGATPNTSTNALTNATLRNGLLIANNGLEKACEINPYIIPGINTYMGELTFESVAQALNMKYTSAESLIK